MIQKSLEREPSFLSPSIEGRQHEGKAVLATQRQEGSADSHLSDQKNQGQDVQNEYTMKQLDSFYISPILETNPIPSSLMYDSSKTYPLKSGRNHEKRKQTKQQENYNGLLLKTSNHLQRLDINDFTEHANDLEKGEIYTISQSTLDVGIYVGGKQYIARLRLLDLQCYMKLFDSEIKLIKNQNGELVWNVSQDLDECSLFLPNIVCIPSTFFQIIFDMQPLIKAHKKEGSLTNTFYVDLSGKESGKYLISKINPQMKIQIEVEVVKCSKKKNQLFNKMNFKMKSELLKNTLVSLQKVRVILRQDQRQYFSTFDTFLPQNKNRNNSEGLVNYLKTCAGSKEFQRLLKVMSEEEINDFISDIYEYIPELVLNQFGNYLIQGLIYACTPPQHTVLFNILIPHFCTLPQSKQGTFTLQRLIQFLTEYQLRKLFNFIEGNFLELARHYHATYFVKKLIQYCEEDIVVDAFFILQQQFAQFATHRNGVCIMREMIQRFGSNHELQVREIMIRRLKQNLSEIINNQYGNYLIQQAYKNFTQNQTIDLDKAMIKYFYKFSTQQFSSLVVLRCLKSFWRGSERMKKLLRRKVPEKTLSNLRKSKHGKKIACELRDYLTEKDDRTTDSEKDDEGRNTRTNSEGDDEEQEYIPFNVQYYTS